MASLYPWITAPPLFPIYLVSLCVHVRVRVCVCVCVVSPLCSSPLPPPPAALSLLCFSVCCPIFPNYLPLCPGQSASSLSPQATFLACSGQPP